MHMWQMQAVLCETVHSAPTTFLFNYRLSQHQQGLQQHLHPLPLTLPPPMEALPRLQQPWLLPRPPLLLCSKLLDCSSGQAALPGRSLACLALPLRTQHCSSSSQPCCRSTLLLHFTRPPSWPPHRLQVRMACSHLTRFKSVV